MRELELSVGELSRRVWERFEGVCPTRLGEVDLPVVVLAVVEELQRAGFVDVEALEGASP